MTSAPGWYPDPTGRHDHRYHNGLRWTGDVASNGRRYVDHVDAATFAAAAAEFARPRPTAQAGGARNAPATASLVLGIVAVTIGWLPFVAVIGVALATAAAASSLAGRRRAAATGVGHGFAAAGLLLAALGFVSTIVGFFLTGVFIDAVERYEQPAAHTVEVTSCVRAGERVVVEGTISNDDDDDTASFAIRVELEIGDVRPRRRLIQVDDVEPGATVAWEGSRAVQAGSLAGDGEPTCVVDRVDGPLPFGFDPG